MRPRTFHKTRNSASVFICLAVALSLCVLLGWTLELPVLTQISPNWIAMQPMTAVTLLMGGLALVALGDRNWPAVWALALLIAAIHFGMLVQHSTGLLPWLDTLLFPSQVLTQKHHLYPGRSAEIVAIEYLLFAAFLVWPRTSPQRYRAASNIATLGVILALIATGGYFLGARELSPLGGFFSMAAPTSLGFVLLFAGALATQNDGNWIHVFTAAHSARDVTLRLLLIVVGWPIVLALLISLTDFTIGDNRLKFAVYALCLSIGLAAAIISFGKRQVKTEAQRNLAIQELEDSRTLLAGILESTREAIITIDDRQRIVFFNPAAVSIFRCRPEQALGEPITRFLPTLQHVRHAAFARSLFGLRGGSMPDSASEMFQARRYDGTPVPVEVSFSPTEADGRHLWTFIIRDISERKEFEYRLQENENRLSLALQAGRTAVWEMDVENGKIMRSDAYVYEILGYEKNELVFLNDWIEICHPEDRQSVLDLMENVIQARDETYQKEMRIKTKEGGWRWVMVQAIAAERNALGRATRIVGTHTDITERKQAEEKIREAALHDPLTGLPNRAFIFEFGSHVLAAAGRTRQHCALLFIDLDRFKPINDVYGHHIGDQVLQEVARRLQKVSRAEDLVGRLGGDEFVILVPHLDGVRQRAVTIAQHVLDAMAQPFQIGTMTVSLSPSIGISYYPENGKDVSDLVYTADLAMYLAKKSGRANYQFYHPELESNAEELYTLEASLKAALKAGGFALYYQPVIDIQTRKLISVEALVRLTDQDGQAISPQRFIPIAEAAGLIAEIGEWVALEACRQHHAWLKQGLHIVIAINVSPVQFRQPGFAEKISEIITACDIQPASLQLEVTESAVMESVDEAIAILTRIKQLGLKVALDDFGTGYSNLSRLSSLPLDKLKVDQSFVKRIESDPASRVVTDTIIALGRSLNLEVIGEGIESEQTLHYLQQLGCHQAQGYLFSKPLPADQFVQWYKEQAFA